MGYLMMLPQRLFSVRQAGKDYGENSHDQHALRDCFLSHLEHLN
jgi:hypothetical protein